MAQGSTPSQQGDILFRGTKKHWARRCVAHITHPSGVHDGDNDFHANVRDRTAV